MTDESIAQNLYRAYGEVTDFKNYQGLPMPKWEDLTPTIQRAWTAAGKEGVSIGTQTKYGAPYFDDRELAQIRHAIDYADKHSKAGAVGHTAYLLIAKLAKALGKE